MTTERDLIVADDKRGGEVSTSDAPNVRVLGGAAVAEIRVDTVLIPEISEGRKNTFAPFNENATYLVECSDDRELTEDSVAKLSRELNISPENFIRVYGGLPGMSRRALVAINMYYGPATVAKYVEQLTKTPAGHNEDAAGIAPKKSEKSFILFTEEYRNRAEATSKVKLAVHSAEKNEANTTELNMDSDQGLGCAYCQGICVVTELCASDGNLRKLAEEEVPASLGVPAQMDLVTASNRSVGDLYFGSEGDKQPITRADIELLGAPVAILDGEHASADDAVVVLNYTTDVSNPSAANKTNVPYYSVDVLPELIITKKALPELFNDEGSLRALLHVIEHDARAVREALANHEGKTAKDLALERHGDAESAIAFALAA